MFAELPIEFQARPPRDDDAPSVAALMNAFATAFDDVADTDAKSVREDWEYPGFNRDADAVVLTDAAGHIVGYGWVWQSNEPGLFEVDGYVHPDQNGRGLGTYLVRWAEARAGERAAERGLDAPVKLHRGHMATDASAATLLAREGYHVVRHFWRMEISMQEPPPVPVVPEGLAIRTFIPGTDDYASYETVEESFADHWGHTPRSFEQWRTRIEGDEFDPSLWFLAVEGDQVAGVTLAKMRGENGWVQTVGVRRPWRHRGLARALLLTAFRAFYERGIRIVGLGVDAQSLTGATRVYERAGMSVRTRYDLYEKVASRADLASVKVQQLSAGV
jgi:mycothiol synthase